MKLLRELAVVGASLVLATVAFTSNAAAQQPPTPVRVEPAAMVELQQLRRVNGEVRARHRSLVAVREEGIVVELHVREGDRVTRGQALAQLDVVRLADELAILDAERAEAQAALAEQQAALERARRDLAALEGLAERDAVKPKELADAKSQVAIDTAREARLRAGLQLFDARKKQWEQRVADMQPKAPFDGVVVARHTDLGAWLAAGATLVELVAVDDLEAVVDVPQTDYAAVIETAAPLEIDVAGARVVAADWRIVPAINAQGRTFPLHARLPAGTLLAPGMSVVAEVPTSTRAPQLVVSRDALLRGPTGFHVFVARSGPGEGAPPVAAIAPVDVLYYHGEHAAVRMGAVQPGDLVVVEGNERLYPGAALALPKAAGSDSKGDAPAGGAPQTEGSQR
jgi:RND family efflux transporter MFP subunit